MLYPDLNSFLSRQARMISGKPLAVVFDEDGVALPETLDHLQRVGFAHVVVFGLGAARLPGTAGSNIHGIPLPALGMEDVVRCVNAISAACPGTWMHYCYNAEFLHYPFCETRSVGELLAFHAEERRSAMLTYVVDLYASDLGTAENGVDIRNCCFDRSGYYAQGRVDAQGKFLERQWNFHGGLRWRFEEHVPETRRRIDRIGLFRAKPGLKLTTEHVFTDPEYNTVSCPWHHNLTAAICSFRAAKALRSNPGSRERIAKFTWHNSAKFEWSSQQLMDLGLMEPGQWF